MNPALEDVVRQQLDALGYDLVELRRSGTSRRPLLDVRIDRRDGERVGVNDCAGVSRALEPVLESSGLIGSNYVLEVSSPGVERPLRSADDWRRFSGRTASVVSSSLGGRQEVEVVGVESSEGSETAVVRDARGAEHRVPLAEISEARLVFRWKE
jgi:ribosome maturation factor RimP